MRGARPERRLEQTIARSGAIVNGESIAIACSGGPDSIALVAALAGLAKPMRLQLIVVHVNHGVRASSWQDECVVRCIATTLKLPLEVALLRDVAPGEASLREARYAALSLAARRHGAGAIATAHHAEDQSETVLLALFRGTGPAGLAGMPVRRELAPGVEIVRPLLGTAPETLRDYCHAQGLPYAVDPTNTDASIRRNAVREALASLRPLFPGLDEAVARATALSAEQTSGAPRAALRQRVRECLSGQQELRDVDFAHVEAAVRAIERGGTGRFHMKAGVCLEVDRGVIAGITRT